MLKRRTNATMLDSLDQAIGRVLAAVEMREDADNTLILFMSDNGGAEPVADNQPFRGGKFEVYEGGIRVCAAIRWNVRGWNAGQTCEEMLGYIDIAPTVLAAAGGTLPGGERAFYGIDLAPILERKIVSPDRPWFSYFAQGGRPAGAAVTQGEWKLVHIGGEVLQAKKAGKVELYELRTDPA